MRAAAALAGVEGAKPADRQARAVPGGAQAAQHVLHLRNRLGRPGRGHGARHVHEGGPCGAQVPDRRGELVFPAGAVLAGALAVAGPVVHVLPAPGSTTRPAGDRRSRRWRTAARAHRAHASRT